MSLDQRGSGIINSARTVAQDVVSPLQTLADDVVNPASDWLDGLGRANELQAENQRLQRQLADARSEVAAAKGSAALLHELQQILDLPTIEDSNAVTAEVITQRADNFTRTFQIAKGSDAGIVRDMPVVVGDQKNGAALVGKVVSVSKTRSIIRRIDDRNFGVGAQLVQGTGFGPAGTATGQANSNLLRFSVILDSANGAVLKKGDVAVTLGTLGEFVPKNLVIGTIVRDLGAGGAIGRDAELRPVVDLDALTIVKVLKYPPVPAP
jgi:rod shape-determining protein MreC